MYIFIFTLTDLKLCTINDILRIQVSHSEKRYIYKYLLTLYFLTDNETIGKFAGVKLAVSGKLIFKYFYNNVRNSGSSDIRSSLVIQKICNQHLSTRRKK